MEKRDLADKGVIGREFLDKLDLLKQEGWSERVAIELLKADSLHRIADQFEQFNNRCDQGIFVRTI